MDPELSDLASPDSKVLRDKMHELRRARTDSWGIYSPPGEKYLNYEYKKQNIDISSRYCSIQAPYVQMTNGLSG